MKIGIIGAGRIGAALARRLGRLGHDVTVANSRGPQSLTRVSEQTGATAGTVSQVATDSDVVLLAVPLRAVAELPPSIFAGKIVVDATNYQPQRDGRIQAITRGRPSSGWVADQLPGARVVKAFNTIRATQLDESNESNESDESEQSVRSPRRIALPIAGDDPRAKTVVAQLADDLGFDTVDDGSLADSWRQEPNTPVYASDKTVHQVHLALAEARHPLDQPAQPEPLV